MRVITRVAIKHAGRSYVAIRYKGGRVELYQVDANGLELFMRYARPSFAAIDRIAIKAVADQTDPAAIEAALVLSGAYGASVRNVYVVAHVSPLLSEPWGTVQYEAYSTHTGRWYPRSCSIRLFNKIAE